MKEQFRWPRLAHLGQIDEKDPEVCKEDAANGQNKPVGKVR